MPKRINTSLINDAIRDERSRNSLAALIFANINIFVRASRQIGPKLRARGFRESDVAQEGTAEAVRQLSDPRFENRGSAAFRSFYLTITRNIVSALGRRKGDAPVRLDTDVHGSRLADRGTRPDVAAEQAETLAEIQEFFNGQDLRHVRAFLLHDDEGCSFETIGTVLGVSHETARKWVREIERLGRERFPGFARRGSS
jgi:RNA polymerase sigma factor (sigma-70 family)